MAKKKSEPTLDIEAPAVEVSDEPAKAVGFLPTAIPACMRNRIQMTIVPVGSTLSVMLQRIGAGPAHQIGSPMSVNATSLDDEGLDAFVIEKAKAMLGPLWKGE